MTSQIYLYELFKKLDINKELKHLLVLMLVIDGQSPSISKYINVAVFWTGMRSECSMMQIAHHELTDCNRFNNTNSTQLSYEIQYHIFTNTLN